MINDVVVTHFSVIDRQNALLQRTADVVQRPDAPSQGIAVEQGPAGRLRQAESRRRHRRFDNLILVGRILQLLGDLEHAHIPAQPQPDGNAHVPRTGGHPVERGFGLPVGPPGFGRESAGKYLAFDSGIVPAVLRRHHGNAVCGQIDRARGVHVPEEKREGMERGPDRHQRRPGSGRQIRRGDLQLYSRELPPRNAKFAPLECPAAADDPQPEQLPVAYFDASGNSGFAP